MLEMQDLTLEGIRQFTERFPSNLIAINWSGMLREEPWENEEDLDPFAREADCLFCGGDLEMQDIGEYWAFRVGLLEPEYRGDKRERLRYLRGILVEGDYITLRDFLIEHRDTAIEDLGDAINLVRSTTRNRNDVAATIVDAIMCPDVEESACPRGRGAITFCDGITTLRAQLTEDQDWEEV